MAGVSGYRVHKLLFVGETLLMMVAGIAAFALRFEFSTWSLSDYPNLFPKLLLAVLVTQLCLYYNDLYHFRRMGQLHNLILAVLQGLGAAVVVLLGIYYAFPSVLIGRGVFFLMIVLFFMVAFFNRLGLQLLSRNGYLSQNVLVLGSDESAVSILRYLGEPRRFAYRHVGFLEEDLAHLGSYQGVGRIVGSYKNLFQTALRERLDLIIVALEDRRGKLPLAELAECKLHGIQVLDAARFWEAEKGVISMRDIRPSWLIFSDGFRQSRVSMLIKEVLEFTIALSVLVVTAPIMALCAIAIRLNTPGPIFYRQVRVGERGRVFTLLKFRSMRADAEADGNAQWAAEDDPRVTRVGRILRKYRLDELPQLFNVIRGQMSLVGPRPERPQFVDALLQQVPCYAQRLAVKPGVTGLAQVRMRYGASVDDAMKKLEYDLYYVKNLSISLDFAILLDTLKVVLLGKGAR
ncbi:MAG: TIGR03013 family XrtA/PEP-CTERM system glycosyltransferase [Pseudomonadota bacterium]